MADIPLVMPLLPSKNDYMHTLSRSWNEGTLTNFGALHKLLEWELCSRMCTNAVLMANGTMALTAVLCAFDLKGEIITTPFTYPATAQAILAAGCTPVFSDIDPDTLCLDPVDLPVRKSTCALLPVHVFGTLCDMAGFEEYRPQLKVIYDSAHAFDLNVANAGDASAYSLHATKLFHTIEGGIATTRDEEALKKLKLYRAFGIAVAQGKDITGFGVNAKLSEAHACMGLCVLPLVEEERSKRAVIARIYSDMLCVDGIKSYSSPNGQYYVIRIDERFADRDEVLGRLAQNGVKARAYFEPSLCDTSFFGEFAKGGSDCPNARLAAKTCLALPFYGGMTADQAQYICSIVLDCRR